MNNILVRGLVTGVRESHFHGSERFMKATIEVERHSGVKDLLPVIFSAYTPLENGEVHYVSGSIRVKNGEVNGRKKKTVYIFVTEVLDKQRFESLTKDLGFEGLLNITTLQGKLIKEPVARVTPSGKDICDSLIEVRHPQYNKSWYIPVIFWGRMAKIVGTFPRGKEVRVTGRFQSRDYVKTTEAGQVKFTVNEVSVNTMEVCDEEV